MTLKLVSIDSKRAEEITQASGGAVEFMYMNGSIKELAIETPLGKIYVKIDNYSIQVMEKERKNIFYLGFFTDVADQKIFIEKEFEHESSRSDYIDRHLSVLEKTESELVLETREVEA